jgi:hypothetical protein
VAQQALEHHKLEAQSVQEELSAALLKCDDHTRALAGVCVCGRGREREGGGVVISCSSNV